MALEYVGGLANNKVGATSGNTTVNFSGLTGGSYSGGLQEGDLVIVAFATGSATDRTLSITDGSTEYTLIDSELYSNGTTYDTNLRVAYKIMGSTPDTSLTIGPTGNTADGGAWAVHVWRGVDPTTPFDGVTPQTATGTGTSRPNPPSVTPTTSGAKVIAACGGACSTGTTAFTFASANNLVQSNGADNNDGRASLASYDWTSGALDPAASSAGSNNAADSWAAMTFVLKPYVAPPAGLTVTELTHKESTTTGDITTSSFTPADGSLLVAVSTLLAGPDTFWTTDADTDDWLNQTITDSAGLTWTRRTGISADDNGTHDSWVSEVVIWTAPVTTGVAMTVTFGESSGVSFGGERVGYIFQVTGHDTADPIGAVGTNQGWNQASPSVTLGAAPASSSIVLGAIATDNDTASAGAITTGSGFTQVDERQGQTWLSSQVQSRASSTSTSVPWTKTGLYTHAAAAIEIKAAPAATRPSLRSAISYSFSAAAGSIDCPYPTGIVAGDALVAWVWTNQDQTLDVPAGWARLGTQRNQVGTFAMSMFVRTATGGESGSVTFNVSNTPDYLGAAIAAVKDVDATTPWQTTIGSASGASDANRSIPIPAVDNDNSFAITYSAGFETITGLPSAFTEEWVYDNMGQYYKDVDAGSATNASQTQNASNAWIAQTAVFIPGTSSGTNSLTASSLAGTAAVLGSPVLTQLHALLAGALSGTAEVVGSPAITQVHGLSGSNLDGSAPTVGSVDIAQVHDLSADGVDCGAGVVGEPDISVLASFGATSIATSSPTVGSPAIAQVHDLAADNVASGDIVVGTPTASETDVLAADSLDGSASIVGTPSVSQVHDLSWDGIVVGAPTVGTPSLAENSGVMADNLVVGDPVVGTPTISQVHELNADSLDSSVPTIGTPDFIANSELLADGLVGSSVEVGTPDVAQVHSLDVSDVAVGALETADSTISQVHVLSPDSLDSSAPVVGTPTVSEGSVISVDDCVVGTPVVGSPGISQVHDLSGDGVVAGVVEFAEPDLAQTYALSADGVDAGAPVLGSPSLSQDNSIVAVGIDVGSPEVGTPDVTQVHSLTADEVDSGSVVCGSPDISQAHELAAGSLNSSAPELETPNISEGSVILVGSIDSGTVEFTQPDLTQGHVLAADSIDVGQPVVLSSILTQVHSLGFSDLEVEVPEVGTPDIVSVSGVISGLRRVEAEAQNRSVATAEEIRSVSMEAQDRSVEMDAQVRSISGQTS